MRNEDYFGTGEFVVEEIDGSLSVTGAGGEVVAVFHGVDDFDTHPVWCAFIDGLIAKDPNISIWSDQKGRYHVSGGCKWNWGAGCYEDEMPSPAPKA